MYFIKARIEDAFRRSAEVEARRVGVETDGGKVILRGSSADLANNKQVQAAYLGI